MPSYLVITHRRKLLMSISQLNKEVTTEDVEQNARDYWKEKADLLSIEYANNIPTEKLKQLVQQKLAEPVQGTRGATYLEKLAPEVRKMLDDANALVRFRIRVLDPTKANWTGMWVTAGNDNLSPVTRAIYFIDQEWHAERIILNTLKNMKYGYRPPVRRNRFKGDVNDHEKPRFLPMFHIEELPLLTEQELKDLAVYQSQNNSGQYEK